MHIGREIRRVRRLKRKSQKWVAEQTSISQKTIWNWENERTKPVWNDIVVVFSALGYEVIIQERTYPRR